MSEWMLWGRYGGSVQLGSAPPPRLFFVPRTASIESVTRDLDRAASAESDGVVFPASFFDLAFRDEIILRCQHRKLRIVHQIMIESLAADSSGRLIEALTMRLEAGDAAEFVFRAKAPPSEELIELLREWPEQTYFTYSVRAADPVLETLENLPKYVTSRLFFHFPYHTNPGDGHMTCAKINKLILEAGKRLPEIKIRPLLGLELLDPRVDPALDLEPMLEPAIELRSADGVDHKNRTPIEVSVIIPSYNNRDYLVNTIKHLVRQHFPRSAFEIVVVDDGSTDRTEEAIRKLVEPLQGKINFKYIFSPRPAPRKMGDANYRAGISRNLGVKNSRGKILCFLDSDILTPANFLFDLIEKHRHYDVVQCKRLNLVCEKSDDSIRFEEIEPARDTFTTEDGYWEKFHALKNWESAPFFWKYTCTYGLSISARLFKRVGWIRRGFVFYGFEDVELGYRLARVGARFHLNDMVTYHLFHKNERSEFRNSDYLRQTLLAKTAQIFYLGHLDHEIFSHFRGLMNEQLPLSLFVDGFIQKSGLNRVSAWAKSLVAEHPKVMTPILALRNWRWLAWRRKIQIISFYKAHLEWRLRVWTRRLQGPMWRVRVHFDRAAGSMWRLRVPFDKTMGSLWRLRVPFDKAMGSMWRLRVPFDKAMGSLWRLRVWFDRIRGSTWKFRVAILRLGAMRPVLHRIAYPIRKVYYFSIYQWNSRVRRLNSRGSE